MNYKETAYKVLKMKKKPLHSQEIAQIAIKKGWLKTKGKTPEITMNSLLIRDISSKKEKSCFIKKGPSVFFLNNKVKEIKKTQKSKNYGKIISENLVKNAISAWLSNNNWKIKDIKTLQEKGVDIIAEKYKYSRRFFN